MEPVTHILTGACLARTGLNRRAAYATLAMAVAAEFPDIDTLWSLRGPVSGFEHHRGITHTFVGIPVEAALIVAAVYGLHRWRLERARRSRSGPESGSQVPQWEASRPLTVAPVRWGTLYAFTLLALLSHLWLDYTNNYGLRPFFPFNPRWYAASITFIFDPLMFALLLGALVLPPLFRLVGTEVGARRQPFAARGWSAAALLGVCVLWSWRAVEHGRAVDLAMTQTIADPASSSPLRGTLIGLAVAEPSIDAPLRYLRAQRVLASPDPIDPRRWYSVTDFGPLYQLATVDVENGTVMASAGPLQRKPQPTLEERLAEGSALGRAYLDWSPMPFLDEERIDPNGGGSDLDDLHHPLRGGETVVTFRDPRFLGESPWLHMARTRAPLTGTVEIDERGRIVRQTMDGKVQR